MATTEVRPSSQSTEPVLHRWGPRLAVLGATIVGLTTLAVGVGLGPRHAAKEGLGPTALLGFLLAAVGVVAVVWATVRILRSVRRRWWFVVVPAILVAAYLSLWTLGQAVAATYAPRPPLGAATPASVGLDYRSVDLRSSDDVSLAGWYVPSRNGAAVVVLHGAGSTRSAVLPHASVLAEHGYGVLLLDARGHGQSSGRGMDFGWYGEADAAGAVTFLARQPDVDPARIGLLGLSMGGEQAIGAAGADPRVAAVVAEGATARVAADKGYLSSYGLRGEAQQWIDRLTFAATDLLSDAPRPDSLRHSVTVAARRPDPTRFLLIAAGDVETEGLAADFIRADHDAVRTWTAPGAGHTQGLETAPAEWERRVVGFLDVTLR